MYRLYYSYAYLYLIRDIFADLNLYYSYIYFYLNPVFFSDFNFDYSYTYLYLIPDILADLNLEKSYGPLNTSACIFMSVGIVKWNRLWLNHVLYQ